MIYISLPSAKDPDGDRRYPGKSTVEIVALRFPQWFEQHWIHLQTPIKNFYLTGSDVVTAGIGGALMGGVLTATRMLGWRAYRVKQLLDGVYRPTLQPQATVEPTGLGG